jgi:hypothetical protein
MTWFLEVLKSSELRGGKWKNLCISIFGLKCVAKICRRMTKDLYFISDCYPYLAKSSYGWLPLWLQTKIPIKTTPGKTNLQSKIPIHCFFFFMSGNTRDTWCPILWMHVHTNKTVCSHARNCVGTIDKWQLTPMQVPYIQDHVTMVPQAYDGHLNIPACSINTLFIIQTLLNQQIPLRLHIISLMSTWSTFQFPMNDKQNWWNC